MRTFSYALIIFISLAIQNLCGQPCNNLIGTIPALDNVSILDFDNNSLSSIIDLTDTAYDFGESTYDPMNNIYFFSKSDGIYVVDVESQSIVTIINEDLKSIEYDLNTNSIYGIEQTGAGFSLVSINLDDFSVNVISILNGVTNIFNAEGTFDNINRRMFVLTNLGITIIDVTNGNIINSFNPFTNGFTIRHLEYSPIDDVLYGTYWNGTNQVFAEIDIITGQLTDINILPGVQVISLGESTFSPNDNILYIETNLGVIKIDATDGTILGEFMTPGYGNFEAIYEKIIEEEIENDIPTLGEWALFCLAIILLIFNIISIKEKQLDIEYM